MAKALKEIFQEQRGRKEGLPSIEERVPAANARSRVGDWEGDLIRGFKGQGYIAILVERKTGLLVAASCPSKHADVVNRSILEALKGVPSFLIKTIIFERGKEFYGYEVLKSKLKANIYFCHPHCPNERGQNEQANGFFRQFSQNENHYTQLQLTK